MPLVSTLRAILLAVAVVDGLVCLYALVQTLRADRWPSAGGRSPCCARPAPARRAVPRLLAGVVVGARGPRGGDRDRDRAPGARPGAVHTWPRATPALALGAGARADRRGARRAAGGRRSSPCCGSRGWRPARPWWPGWPAHEPARSPAAGRSASCCWRPRAARRRLRRLRRSSAPNADGLDPAQHLARSRRHGPAERAAPGSRCVARTELLGPRPRPRSRPWPRSPIVTDAHVLDAESPARVTFLDRLGPPFQSTFRPHETLTAQVLAGPCGRCRRCAPDVVIQGGDLIDNDQANELALALAVLPGRPRAAGQRRTRLPRRAVRRPTPIPSTTAPTSTRRVHPGLLHARHAAVHAARARRAPWLPVLGDHDILVAGEIAPTAQTRALALGDQAVWDLPPGLTAPPSLSGGRRPGRRRALPGRAAGARAGRRASSQQRARRPQGPGPARPAAGASSSPPRRSPRCSGAAAVRPRAGCLDYAADLGAHVRVLVLDLARRARRLGRARPRRAGGLARPGNWPPPATRWVLVVSHQPLASSRGRRRRSSRCSTAHPRVIAAVSGHTHRNRIVARRTAAGGYWLISTASLIDFPQQARALRVLATADGGVAIQTWMLDHVVPGRAGHDLPRAGLPRRAGRPARRGSPAAASTATSPCTGRGCRA